MPGPEMILLETKVRLVSVFEEYTSQTRACHFRGFSWQRCEFENWHLFHSCAIKLHLHLNEITIALCQDENSLRAQATAAIYDLLN